MTTFWLTCMPGSIRTVAPVARIRLSNEYDVVPPSWSLTSIALAPVIVPQPSISVILFFFIRKWTPLTMPALTWRDRAWVGPNVIVASPVDAVLVLVVGEHVRQLGVPEQRLGGDAADVEADAAPVLVLDDRDGLAELRGADRRDVPAGAGTEHQHVEVSHVAHPIADARLRGWQALA